MQPLKSCERALLRGSNTVPNSNKRINSTTETDFHFKLKKKKNENLSLQIVIVKNVQSMVAGLACSSLVLTRKVNQSVDGKL